MPLWQRTEIQALLYIDSLILKAKMVSFVQIRAHYEVSPKRPNLHIYEQRRPIPKRWIAASPPRPLTRYPLATLHADAL